MASQLTDVQTERLLDLEPRLRKATQAAERAPLYPLPPPQPVGNHAIPRGVLLSTTQARTILRAILPACLALGRTRRATLRLHAALADLHAAIPDCTDPTRLPGAIQAATELAAALDEWIDEARWRAATSKAGVAWSRPGKVAISAVTRQSSAARQQRNANTAAQRTLLLPIAGEQPHNQPKANETPADERRSA